MNKSTDDNKLQATKLAPPPKNLPIYGRDKPEFVSYVAWSNYAAALEQKRFLFGVRRRDQRRNTLIVGRPGMGKTKLLQTMIRQDFAHGHGCLVLDFQGDLADLILGDVPESRIDDVVYLNPHDVRARLAMNPLANLPATYRQPFAASLVATYKGLYSESWSPALEYLLHNLLLAVLHHPNGTLRMAYEMLHSDSIRTEVAEEISDSRIGQFFQNDYPDWRDKHESAAVIPLMNMLRTTVLHPDLEDLCDTSFDHVELGESIRNKSIVIIRLQPEYLGDTNAVILANMFLGHIFAAMQQRGGKDIDTVGRDFPIYLDEHPRLQDNFVLNFIQSAGSRGLPCTIATRGLVGVDETSAQRLMNITDNIFCFRLFAEDAYRLKNETLPVFDTRDLQNLGKREMYCRIVIDDDLSVPFSAETLDVLPTPGAASAVDVKAASENSFGLPKEDVY